MLLLGLDVMCDVERFLTDPNTCALYLTDALETGDVTTICAALDDIARATKAPVSPMGGRSDISLTELLVLLENAGLQLTAQPMTA